MLAGRLGALFAKPPSDRQPRNHPPLTTHHSPLTPHPLPEGPIIPFFSLLPPGKVRSITGNLPIGAEAPRTRNVAAKRDNPPPPRCAMRNGFFCALLLLLAARTAHAQPWPAQPMPMYPYTAAHGYPPPAYYFH